MSICISMLCGRIGGFLATNFIGYFLSYSCSATFYSFSTIALIAGCISFILPNWSFFSSCKINLWFKFLNYRNYNCYSERFNCDTIMFQLWPPQNNQSFSPIHVNLIWIVELIKFLHFVKIIGQSNYRKSFCLVD